MTVWALVPLLTCFAYIILLIVSTTSGRRRVNRIFALFLGIAAAWSFSSFMLHLDAPESQTLFWNQLVVVGITGITVAYYHFIRAYTNRPAGYGVWTGYVLVVALAVLALTGNVVDYSRVVDGVLDHSLGYKLWIVAATTLVFVAAALRLLVKKYRAATDYIDRRRTVYLLIGWSVTTAGSYITNLIPPLDGLPLEHIGGLVNTLIIAYTIRRFSLFDIRMFFRKGLVYSGLTVLITAAYLLMLYGLQSFFQDRTNAGGLVLAGALALLIAVLFNPLRNSLQNLIDRFFYRQTYDYRKMLLSFAGEASNVLDLDELADSILESIVRAVRIEQAALMFPEGTGGDFVTRFLRRGDPDSAAVRFRLAQDSPIVAWIGSEGKALRREQVDVIPQLKGLWQSEKTTLDEVGLSLLCPVRSRGKLIGILALWPKLSGTGYSDEDVDLFLTMAGEAALAIENARMLDDLRSQQRQVELLLNQAITIQEEERQRISIDLHDSVAQWLVAASYRAQTCGELLDGNGSSQAREELLGMEETITKSLKELRRVVIGLRPPALDELGLTHAVRQTLDDLKVDGIECSFNQEGEPVRLSPSMEIAVYRVVQESLNNIRKHAHATAVDITMKFLGEELVVDIRDDGDGFDLTQTLDGAASVGHLGLLGMKQRAEMLGGRIDVRTTKGQGTTITLTLSVRPVTTEAQ